MIEEPGKIVALDDQYVWIETVRLSACGSCSAKAGCGQAVMGQLFDESRQAQKNLVRLDRNQQRALKLGQSVLLGIPEDALMKASFLAYGVPVLALIGGAGVGLALEFPDPLVAAAGLVAQLAALFWVRHQSADWACHYRFRPNLMDTVSVSAR